MNPAVITGSAETLPSFYIKTTKRNSYRRNRKHILKTEEEQSDMAEFDDFNVKVENNEDWPIPIVQPAELTTSLTICQHSLHNDYSQRDKQQRLQNFKFNPHWRLEVEEWLKSQSDLKTIYHEHLFKLLV